MTEIKLCVQCALMKNIQSVILVLTTIVVVILPETCLANNSVSMVTSEGLLRMLKPAGIYVGVCTIPLFCNLYWKSLWIRILSVLLLLPQLLFLLICFLEMKDKPIYPVLGFLVIVSELILIAASIKKNETHINNHSGKHSGSL